MQIKESITMSRVYTVIINNDMSSYCINTYTRHYVHHVTTAVTATICIPANKYLSKNCGIWWSVSNTIYSMYKLDKLINYNVDACSDSLTST